MLRNYHERAMVVERELLRDCTPAVAKALAVLVLEALDLGPEREGVEATRQENLRG